MTAQVSITINTAENVLTLPASVLGNAGRNGSYHVAVYDPASGKITPTQVKVGLNNNITAEIQSGLNEGDLVIAARGSATTTAEPANGNRRPGAGGVGGLFGGGGGRRG